MMFDDLSNAQLHVKNNNDLSYDQHLLIHNF
jgi:hypothetical protein